MYFSAISNNENTDFYYKNKILLIEPIKTKIPIGNNKFIDNFVYLKDFGNKYEILILLNLSVDSNLELIHKYVSKKKIIYIIFSEEDDICGEDKKKLDKFCVCFNYYKIREYVSHIKQSRLDRVRSYNLMLKILKNLNINFNKIKTKSRNLIILNSS